MDLVDALHGVGDALLLEWTRPSTGRSGLVLDRGGQRHVWTSSASFAVVVTVWTSGVTSSADVVMVWISSMPSMFVHGLDLVLHPGAGAARLDLGGDRVQPDELVLGHDRRQRDVGRAEGLVGVELDAERVDRRAAVLERTDQAA